MGTNEYRNAATFVRRGTTGIGRSRGEEENGAGGCQEKIKLEL